MHKKKGFSLLSFLLYLMIFTGMTFFLCHIIASLVIPSLTSVRKSQSIMALHIASDIFVRDIHAGVDQWKLVTPHELIWQSENRDIGWSFSDFYLKRTTGLYGVGWKNKTTSIVASGVAKATFTPEKHQGRIVGIELVMESKATQNKPVICYVAVKKGENV
jgi:1,2-phenylacetyl-CoA epoxidase PaaB subunit